MISLLTNVISKITKPGVILLPPNHETTATVKACSMPQKHRHLVGCGIYFECKLDQKPIFVLNFAKKLFNKVCDWKGPNILVAAKMALVTALDGIRAR